jgi:hypothetical protein
MGAIYDMESGRTEPMPAENDTTAVRDETMPALAVRELPSGGTNGQSRVLSIHVISALLKEDWAS